MQVTSKTNKELKNVNTEPIDSWNKERPSPVRRAFINERLAELSMVELELDVA